MRTGRRSEFVSIEDVEKEERARVKRRRLEVINEFLVFLILLFGVVYFGLQVARELVEEIREVLLLLAALIGT